MVPALIYFAFNAGGPGQDGWGIPMATDIAFAVGVLSLLGNRISRQMKVFLLTLAIVDDIGAILVIAIFYTSDLSGNWLLTAAILLAGILVLRQLHVWYLPVYLVIGVAFWLAVLESGVHATRTLAAGPIGYRCKMLSTLTTCVELDSTCGSHSRSACGLKNCSTPLPATSSFPFSPFPLPGWSSPETCFPMRSPRR